MSKFEMLSESVKRITKEIESLREEIRPVNEQIEKLEENRNLFFESLERLILNSNEEIVKKMRNIDSEVNIFVVPDNSDNVKEICEDDGSLHITIGKIHGAFINNQDLTKAEWNKLARPIAKEFGFKLPKYD